MNKTLPDFITEIGDAEAARLFRSPMRTIQSWRRRERTPRPSQATMIIEASGGRVTYEGIYAQPADTSASGEGVSAGEVTRHDLRPDLFDPPATPAPTSEGA